MKRAISYIRISQEDQSNWSISGQSKMIEDFAKSRGIEIVATFTDDGVSAKNFDRAGWKKCSKFLSENRDIDFLIIAKYDRMIRNASQGLAMLEKLEDKYNIKVLSVMENFFIDPHSPYFFKMRADLLVTAEFERRVISDRSKFGVWSARSQGRFIGHAPYGYVNARDEHNKPIIKISEKEADIVRKIFELYLQDYKIEEIKKLATNMGFNRTGSSAIKRILVNPTYAGMVEVPGYKGDKHHLVKGVHEPIITDAVWEAVCVKAGYKTSSPKLYRSEVPYRGLIYCGKCGHFCTGGKSLSKSKKYYWYYRCSNKSCNAHYNADKVNKDIEAMMNHLSYSDDQIATIRHLAQVELMDRIATNSDDLNKLNKDLVSLNNKILSLEAKFISDMINKDTYDRWNKEYKSQIVDIESKISELSINMDDKLARLNERLNSVKSLGHVFQNAKPDDRYRLLKGCSTFGFMYSSGVIRTPGINPIFDYIDLSNSRLKIENDLITTGKMKLKSGSTRSGTEYQTLFILIEKFLAVG
jgi:site-specific DNA recombinase